MPLEGLLEPDHLCERCQTLNLSPTATDQDVIELNLGTEEEILEKRSYCPFCRLSVVSRSQSPFNGIGGPVVVKWDPKRSFHFTNDGHRIVFVDDGCESPLPPHLAGRVIKDQLDPGLVKTWISLCEEHHTPECSPEETVIATPKSPKGLKFLRVIDLHDQCLVNAMPGCRYVALSYVWGKNQSLVLQKSNKSQLTLRGGLLGVYEHLPRTISDAIILVSQIGERYLWVDSLCLVQDDDDDKMDGVQKMDLIYKGAILTVVAGSGVDADAGLPGVRPGSRELTQWVEEVKPGIKMTTVGAMYRDLSELVYMTRGWTYQEFVLSAKHLIFLDSCAYFVCRRALWSEDTIYERFPLLSNEFSGPSQKVTHPRISDGDPWGTLVLMLFRYGSRKLTYQSDILNAVTGILNHVCQRLKSGHIYGLPTVCFDLSLLHWNYPVHEEGGRREEFPSWSWVGWTSTQVGFNPLWDSDQDHGEWLAKETYITWYSRNLTTGSLELVWDPSSQQTYGNLDPEDMGYHRRQPSILFDSRIHNPGLFPTNPTEEVDWMKIRRQYNALQFWAHTIIVSLRCQGTERRVLYISYDNHEHACGSLRVDDLSLTERVTGVDTEVATGFEAIILSRARSCRTIASSLSAPPDKPFYWIMLIARGDGFVERQALGFIYQDCIGVHHSNKLAWKEFLLI